ncbi:tail fiber domain-containing protein [bacterium]|nr:tail fiber domain-containing protein [bacterium]
MKRIMAVLSIVAFAVAVFAAPVEQVISFQGKIVESGTPAEGTRNIEFKLYDVETGGTALWTENRSFVPVTAGLFNVELGAITPFAAGTNVDFSEQYWIGISVAGGAEIVPRYKFGSSAYALNIADVIVKDVDQIFETDLHLDGPMGGDRAIWFGDDHWVGIGEYPLNDDDLLLYCSGDPVWVDAVDIRPTGIYSDLGDGSAEWRHFHLSGKIYADGASPANQYLGTDGSGDLTYLPAPGGSDDDWAYSSGSGLTGDIYHTGNVGIGTTSPATKLHIADNVSGSVFDALTMQNASAIGNSGLRMSFKIGSVTTGQIDNIFYPGGNADFIFSTWDNSLGFSEKMRITGTGNVGIGTDDPEVPLHIESNGHALYIDGASSISTTSFQGLGFQYSWGSGEGAIMASYPSGSGYLTFHTTTGGTMTEKMRITTSGNVGIGTDDPDYKLHVTHTVGAHSTTESPTIWAEVTDGTYTIKGVLAGQNGYQGVYGETDRPSGHGVYGRATGGNCRGINGYAGGTGTTNYGVYGYAGGATTNYGVYCSGSGAYTGSWTDVSDRKFKKNITPMTGILAKVLDLNPVTYEMRTDEYSFMGFSEGNEYGLIAQELNEVFPELVKHGVHPGAEGGEPVEYEGIDYISLTSILVQAVQELKAENDELRARIEALEKK